MRHASVSVRDAAWRRARREWALVLTYQATTVAFLLCGLGLSVQAVWMGPPALIDKPVRYYWEWIVAAGLFTWPIGVALLIVLGCGHARFWAWLLALSPLGGCLSVLLGRAFYPGL